MISTEFTQLVGCKAPVKLAGMGEMATPGLIAAVANAGGLGMLGAASLRRQELGETLGAIREAAPTGIIGVNFLMPFLQPECVELAAMQAQVVEFFYDDPRAELVQQVHQGGALAGWQVGSATEARQAIDAGCDFIVAQGVEAGGHVRGTLPLLLLLEEIRTFARLPVVAAGGVSTGSGLAAALAAGAAAVRVGSRFLVAHESSAHPDYIAALLRAKADDTVLTTAYSAGWPDAPHRVLAACITAAEQHAGESVGTISNRGQDTALPKFHVVPPNEGARGNVAAMCHYAGQSVEGIVQREAAAAIVEDIVSNAQIQLDRATAMLVGDS